MPAKDEEFDWRAYDRLIGELDSLCSAWNGWKNSYTNLLYTGHDDHGVFPNEPALYEQRMLDVHAQIKTLGEPPACTTCRGGRFYHSTYVGWTGETLWEDHPSRCPVCGWLRDEDGKEYMPPVPWPPVREKSSFVSLGPTEDVPF